MPPKQRKSTVYVLPSTARKLSRIAGKLGLDPGTLGSRAVVAALEAVLSGIDRRAEEVRRQRARRAETGEQGKPALGFRLTEQEHRDADLAAFVVGARPTTFKAEVFAALEDLDAAERAARARLRVVAALRRIVDDAGQRAMRRSMNGGES